MLGHFVTIDGRNVPDGPHFLEITSTGLTPIDAEETDLVASEVLIGMGVPVAVLFAAIQGNIQIEDAE
jgi:hypothetical protein